MRDVVEVAGPGGVDNLRMVVPPRLVDFAYRLLGTTPGPLPIGRVIDLGLKARFHDQLSGGWPHAIADRRKT